MAGVFEADVETSAFQLIRPQRDGQLKETGSTRMQRWILGNTAATELWTRTLSRAADQMTRGQDQGTGPGDRTIGQNQGTGPGDRTRGHQTGLIGVKLVLMDNKRHLRRPPTLKHNSTEVNKGRRGLISQMEPLSDLSAAASPGQTSE
ncbi:hypothetical protein INR49_009310, partial [Caranx melampygus]